ncbi:MAG: ABC transporter ATP-binding protein [Actinomycetota bacterium]|nr:ABC transporter ATP-binding protein [Actinomycetota bacterium]
MSDVKIAAVVDFAGVGFVRERRPILTDLTWQVGPGERWVVLGPNGAGKSTLLRLASTYELPTSGRVWVMGRRVGGADLREVRRHIGYVSASLARAMAERSTALDVVVTGKDATLRRWRQEFTDEDWQQATRLLEELGCVHLLGSWFSSLSEGERQRVQIARSLMSDPQLLLLDEPTAGLDLGGREQLMVALSRLAAHGGVPGIVFVTHHVEEIPRGFTHALLLRGGRVLESGPLEQVLTSSSLTACFGLPIALERLDGRYMATARETARL